MKDKTPQQTAATENLFEGWDDASDVDFFSNDDDTSADDDEIKPVNTGEEEEEEEDVTNVSDTDPKVDPDKKKKEEVNVDDVLNFDEADEEADEEEGEEEGEPKKKASKEKAENISDSVALVNALKEKGLIELEEDVEINDENADDLLADSYEDTIEKRVTEMMASLPPVTKDLVKFSLKGGNEADFLSKLTTSQAKGIAEDMDLEKEENQVAVMTANLKGEGYDDEYINAQIDFMKDNGKLATLSKGVHKKIVDKSKAERAAEVKRQADTKDAQKEKLREYKKNLSKLVSESDEISGLTLSKQDKADLPSYMTDANVKNGDSNVTAFQRDLFTALQDSGKAAALAKILRSDFDFSDIANKSKTDQAKKFKKDVRRTSKKTPATSGSSQKPRTRRTLADVFD